MKPIILLAEDNLSDIEFMKIALAKCRIANELIICQDGEETLEYLLGAHELPALVILDLNLPRLNGLDVLHRIRTNKRTQYLPVVICTASDEETDIIRSYTLGANSYMVKSMDFTEFMLAIDTLGLYWLVVNKPAPVKG